MKIGEKIRETLVKLQSLPEQKKKVVLWTIVAVLAVVMGIFWVKASITNLSKLDQEVNKIELPKIEIPNIPVNKN